MSGSTSPPSWSSSAAAPFFFGTSSFSAASTITMRREASIGSVRAASTTDIGVTDLSVA